MRAGLAGGQKDVDCHEGINRILRGMTEMKPGVVAVAVSALDKRVRIHSYMHSL